MYQVYGYRNVQFVTEIVRKKFCKEDCVKNKLGICNIVV